MSFFGRLGAGGELHALLREENGGAQRIFLDRRLVGGLFKDSPVTEIASTETLAQAEVEQRPTMFIASADIKACCYQCGIVVYLIEFACQPRVSGYDARVVCLSAF